MATRIGAIAKRRSIVRVYRLLTAALALLVLLSLAGAPSEARKTGASPAQSQKGAGGVVLFDDDWRFQRGGAQGAEAADFDDSGWRRLDLPHDWSIEDLPGKGTPFDAAAISQVQGGYTVGGTGWYRKAFDVPESQRGKRIVIQFDSVYMNAEVWLNGKRVGEHPYGYTSFWFDLTDQVNFGGRNKLAVKVRNEGENSRWYLR
jgi:beta-galactosidase